MKDRRKIGKKRKTKRGKAKEQRADLDIFLRR